MVSLKWRFYAGLRLLGQSYTPHPFEETVKGTGTFLPIRLTFLIPLG
jgi:hypothetical protein